MPDLLQYGRSDKHVIQGPMWTYHARMMVGPMDALGVERADFVCNSWGGTIALCLAAHYPDRVRSLVIMGSLPVFYGPLAPFPQPARRGPKAPAVHCCGEGPTPDK